MFRPKSTLEQWRIFQAVVEFGGYAQAAERLNKSQSSLNHAVAKLQQTLGVALLEVTATWWAAPNFSSSGPVFWLRS